MKRLSFLLAACMAVISLCLGAEPDRDNGIVTVRPTTGGTRVVSLQAVGDNIVRVRASSKAELPQKRKSLITVPQTAVPQFTVSETADSVTLTTRAVRATVSRLTGAVTFRDASGRTLLREADGGKRFSDYTVPLREIGTDSMRVGAEQRKGLQWQMTFDSPDDEAFYGLGQHQSEELNMKGRTEDLFQYNTKVSVPFVVSNRNYGLLWDSYSYCRFGQACDYLQLHRVFRLYDKDGHEGHLTGTYTDRHGNTLVRQEDSLYYEYDLPDKLKTYETGKSDSTNPMCQDTGGIRNLPQGFNLDGASVVYEGFIEPAGQQPPHSSGDGYPYQFILYYAGYVTVTIGDSLVVPERWRTAWNPNSYKFTVSIPPGRRVPLRIAWKPDGGVSYCGLRVAAPRDRHERGQLTVWSEMAQDMDYYFICGQNLDDVIGGYRTLTGRAPVYPKWVLGYWQSRERYKTQDELVQTMAEFRRRHLPIDNIVQDWNYWPEDQWGSHEFEASRYPDPQQMTDSVHQMHGRFMISVWPKFYCNTDNYRELDQRWWMYHQAVADDIHDWVGKGYVGSFYDAYSDSAREMFWRQMDDNLYTGLAKKYAGSHTAGREQQDAAHIDAWWMDASEPNVRDCTPLWYRKALCGPTALGTSTEYFNAYSLVNAQAIYEGQRSTCGSPTLRRGQREVPRVFLLTRSGFAGLQRYSTATWSGDIGTRWEDMRAQMTAGMNYSLSGLPFWGMDMGGFCVEKRYVKAQQTFDRTGQVNDDLLEWRELQTRWAQFGAFVPLFRAHGQWPLREPWHIAGVGSDAEAEASPTYQSFEYYDRLRYHLMPYLYSMAGWVHLNHYTMMRALVMDFGSDSRVCDIKDQWMFGPSLMACPVSTYKARSRDVYFPEGRAWYDLYTGQLVMGRASQIENRKSANRKSDSGSQIENRKSVNRKSLQPAPYGRIPVFVPEGSIIPFGPAMEWSDEKPAELINLYVYAGRDAQFTLYEDEGTNYNYERGEYSTIDISYDDKAKTVTFGRRHGSFPGMVVRRRFNIVYVSPSQPRPLDTDSPQGTMVTYDGAPITTRVNNHDKTK